MKLYLIPSACSLAAHILVREAELDVDLIKVDFATRTLPDGSSYDDIAPKGQVSALALDDGSLVTENIAVLCYLSSLAPERALTGEPGTLTSIRILEWMSFVATEIHKQIYWTNFNPEAPDAYKAHIRGLLPKRFATLAAQLEKSDFIASGTFTAADAYLTWALHMASLLGETVDPWPSLHAYQERMFNRPSVRDALAYEATA